MENKPYYMAYESRYQKAYEAGAERWGYSPDDEELYTALKAWVEEYQLEGKRIIEFACGEGASGVILSKLGCIYHGVDAAPSALKKAEAVLKSYPNATVSLLDMVNQQISEMYDAALDVMGFHMLVTDSDRDNYLKKVFACLRSGAPMLYFNELCRADAFDENIKSIEDWKAKSGIDYETPQKRFAKHDGRDIEVYIPLLPARPKSINGYRLELTNAGFEIDSCKVIPDCKNPYSISIYIHKP